MPVAVHEHAIGVDQLAAQQHRPAKGALAPGADADIVIFDPDGEAVLPGDGFGDGTGDSVYTGLATRGRIRAVLLRGELIVSDGVLVDGHRPRRGWICPVRGCCAAWMCWRNAR